VPFVPPRLERLEFSGNYIKVKIPQEWAEVCFVPNAIGHSKKGPEYRYMAWREPLKQRALPGMEQGILFPFPTLMMKDKSYKIFGLVTNREMEGEELIHWYWERCGKSEEAHGVMKNDFVVRNTKFEVKKN